MSYGMISMLVIGSLRSPPPIRAAPDFHLKVKRLTMICASLALLQIMFAVHPRESVSHDSQVALLPYESCSLATAVSVGRQKESAFMGRLGALLRPTCTSYAGCAQWTIKLRKAIPSLNA